MNDDTAVREMLRDLTVGQPDAPVDRVAGVRRRYVRRRSLQGATTVVTAAAATVAVLLGVGVLTGSGTSKPKSLQQPPPKSWQLSWPDRSPLGADAVKTRALAFLATRLPAPMRDVHWLFAGRLQTNVTWAVLEASTGSGTVQQLIAISSTDNGKTWAVSSGDAPPPTTKQIGFALADGNWALILTSPGVDQVRLSDLSSGNARVLPVVDTSSGIVLDHLQRTAAPDALLVGTPDLASTFVVRLPDGGFVMPRWERALVSSAPPIAGYRKISGEAGAAPSTDGATITNHGRYFGPMIEVIRCAGQAPLTFSVTASGQTSSQQITHCDGRNVTLHLGQLDSGHKSTFTYTISGDPTVLYALAIYGQKAK